MSALAIYLVCLTASRQVPTDHLHTIDDVLKEHGLPLYAAKTAQVEAMRPAAWARFLPTRAGRLVTTRLRPIDTKQQARKLTDAVLIYCSEPADLRRWGDLLLFTDFVGARMARATPFVGCEGPNKKLLEIGRDLKADSTALEALVLPLKSPLNLTLVHLGRHGRLQRVERRDIIELAHGPRK